MEHFELILTWFCYGWTFVTFPGTVVIIAFSLWADYDNVKHNERIKKMMTEDKD